jgi:hypothetical protein
MSEDKVIFKTTDPNSVLAQGRDGCVIGDYSHYALGVPKGGVLDATREQFAAMEQEAGRVFDMTPWETRPRSYVLSRLDTEKRYGLLRNRVVGKWG